MWLILQHKHADDWVIATGKTNSVRDFVRMCFSYVGIELEFKGKGIEEKGYIKSCSNAKYNLDLGKEVVSVDPNYFRPTEVDLLVGDPSKAKKELGWEPNINLKEMVDEMMISDLNLMKNN